MKKLKLSKLEIKSGLNRVAYAENLILQLPETHNGRNTWLMNYGVSEEAKLIRERSKNISKWDKKRMCLKPRVSQ